MGKHTLPSCLFWPQSNDAGQTCLLPPVTSVHLCGVSSSIQATSPNKKQAHSVLHVLSLSSCAPLMHRHTTPAWRRTTPPHQMFPVVSTHTIHTALSINTLCGPSHAGSPTLSACSRSRYPGSSGVMCPCRMRKSMMTRQQLGL